MKKPPASRFPDPGLFRPGAVSAEVREFNEKLEKLMEEEPPVDKVPPEVSRRLREEGTPRTGFVVLSPIALERRIPGPAGEIPVRIFLPEEIRGAYLHIHGGGWVIGGARLQDPYLEDVARRARCAVISVDYRLAPEHPYPAAPDDCEAAAQWLLKESRKEFGVERIVIGGESAGAHLAAVTLLRLRKRSGGETGFAGAILNYGIYDLEGTPSLRNWGDRRLVLNTPVMRWFIDHFVPPDLRRNPDVSPLHAAREDLVGLPPALFTVGTLDLLLDDSMFMAARWTSAGNETELAVYPGAVHGFLTFDYGPAEKANARAAEFLGRCFGDGSTG